MDLSISEQLMHSTVRIEVLNSMGGIQSTGTGFFFSYSMDEEKRVLVLVTNKHVVKNAKTGRLVFTISAEGNSPKYGETFSYVIEDFEQAFLPHPEGNIDLCIMPMQPIIDDARIKHNKNFFIISLEEVLIPTEKQVKDLSALEDVIMIGYPNGLWDEANNLPIIRRGITAIHPKFDYNHKTDIVVDIAAFPGSSGSPICIFNQGSYVSSNDVIIGSRFLLLGILYAGPQQTVVGEIYTATIPTSVTPMTRSNVMMNLGYAVKSRRLLDFKTILKSLIR